MLGEVLVVVAGYLLGTFPTAALVGRLTGHDPTAEGSGNPGATNVYRTSGRGAGVAVLLDRPGQGRPGRRARPPASATTSSGVAAGAAAVLGHVAPVTRRFRGGKGVATAAGAWPSSSSRCSAWSLGRRLRRHGRRHPARAR